MSRLAETSRAVFALIPAAGHGTRLAGLIDGSKELVDIGGKPVVSHVLDQVARAGVERALMVLREDKDDISAWVAGIDSTLDVALLMVPASPSELYSVAAGLEASHSDSVLLAYPDLLIDPPTALAELVRQHRSTRVEVTLGLFPTEKPDGVDMVDFDDQGTPNAIVIKQPDQGLRYSWSIAAWSPVFSRFLVDSLESFTSVATLPEPSVGHVIQGAIEEGMTMGAVRFESGSYLDVGTPEGLDKARRLFR